MRDLAIAYKGLVRVAVVNAFEYRAQVVLWTVSAIFPLIMMAVWLSIVDEAGPAAGWDSADFVAYYVGVVLVERCTQAYSIWRWDRDIRLGELSTRLLQPIHPFHHQMTQEIGWKVTNIVLVVPVIVAIIWISPTINYPLDAARFGVFLLSLIAGFLLSMIMGTAFAMLSFWSTQSMNIFSLWFGVGQFLSGFIAPLALLPPVVHDTAMLMPFRSIISLPIEILMGRLDWPGIGAGFAVTGGWLVFFWLVYRVLWHWGIRHYEAVGA